MKPALLFLSPTAPLPTGHGLGMRAHAVMRVLAERYRVYLLVANDPPAGLLENEELNTHCAEVAFLSTGLWSGGSNRVRTLAAAHPLLYRLLYQAPLEWARLEKGFLAYPFSIRDFEVVHVFRLYMIPFYDRLKEHVSWRQSQLDVDDLESLTRRRIAAIHRLNGKRREAVQLEVESEQYSQYERKHLYQFDRLFVCSEVDRGRMLKAGLHPSPEIVPNIVSRINIKPLEKHAGFRLLFVGSLGYAPNSDAVLYFFRDILPLIRKNTKESVFFDVAGGGMSPGMADIMKSCPGVHVLGRVRDMETAYARADAVVVPLRAGGGTRIKILEAFAYGRPVVSTPQGIEGIAAKNEVHALIAEGADTFAQACGRLIREIDLREKLVSNACSLVSTQYSQDALRLAFFKDSNLSSLSP